MAIDTDALDEVREALTAADSVDDTDIHLTADGDALVLQGSVATFEQSAAAEHIAAERADAVRNELVVDHNLREGPDSGRSVNPDSEAVRRDGLRGSSYDPLERADDVVADVQSSLDENVPWDPPHESVEVPTRAESRGVADRRSAPAPDTGDALLDETADGQAGSLPDVSAEELAQAAHPAREEDR